METLSITFTGDICITGSFLAAFKSGDELIGEELSHFLKNSDFVVANLEGAETNAEVPAKPGVCLKNPIGTIEYLRSNNISILNLANNHIMDYGVQGLTDTLQAVHKSNMHYFGAGMNENVAAEALCLEKNGLRIALIGCAHGEGMMAEDEREGVFWGKNVKRIKAEISEAKKKADFIILNYHGGAEFNLYPISSKRKLLKKYIGYGADVVIAHHPHVIQASEIIKDKIIFYSLGNFIFDWEAHIAYDFTNIGLLTKFTFTKTKYNVEVKEVRIKEGMVKMKETELFNKVKDLNNYKTKFQKDALRIWTERKIQNNSIAINDQAKKKWTFNKIRKLKYYYQLLTDESSGPILRAALFYKFKKWIGVSK